MKTFWKILRAMLAIIGGVTLLFAALIFCQLRFGKEPVHIHFYPSYKVQASAYLDSLKASGSYCTDTVEIHMASVKDSVRATEIMEYFHLDTLYNADATTAYESNAKKRMEPVAAYLKLKTLNDNPFCILMLYQDACTTSDS